MQRVGAEPPFKGQSGWLALERLRNAIHIRLCQLAARRAALIWLMWARRLPVSTLSQVPLAEAGNELWHLAWGTAVSSPRPNGVLAFVFAPWRLTPRVLADIDDLLCLALIERNVRVAQRRVAKGQEVILTGSTFNFEVTGTDSGIEQAISLYDMRLALTGRDHGGRLGAFLGGVASRVTDTSVATWVDLRDQNPLLRSALNDLLSDRDPVIPVLTDLAKLAPAVFEHLDGVTLHTQAVVTTLQAAWAWLERRRATSHGRRGTWTANGYLRLPRRFVAKQFATGPPMPGLLGREWLRGGVPEALHLLQEGKDRVLYPVGPWFVMDLLTASAVLPSTLRRPEAGSGANAWGTSFEHSVQNLLDSSPWRPTGRLRALIGRNIRLPDGSQLTDIDCVGRREETLLLISCKAITASEALLRGEHAAVETARQKVEQASSQWQDRMRVIVHDPALLGVSLPPGVKIEGLVVVPSVPYVHLGPATQRVLDLLYASSVDELLLAVARSVSLG